MEKREKYQYYIVERLHHENQEDKFTCVPGSWVMDRIAVMRFPDSPKMHYVKIIRGTDNAEFANVYATHCNITNKVCNEKTIKDNLSFEQKSEKSKTPIELPNLQINIEDLIKNTSHQLSSTNCLDKQQTNKETNEKHAFVEHVPASSEEGNSKCGVERSLLFKVIEKKTSCNKSDNKGTLRYEKEAEGLVELVVGTGVYVNRLGIYFMKQNCLNSTEFARELLPHVFSLAALRTCSLHSGEETGKNAESARPGLDSYALGWLLEAVAAHARDKNWEVLETPQQLEYHRACILRTLRNKMTEMRLASELNLLWTNN